MKTAFLVVLFAFSLVTAYAGPAKAGLIVSSKVNFGADQQHIAPFIRVQADGPILTNIGGFKIRYYFYDNRLPTFATPTITPTGTSINVAKLDRTYTGALGKNANYVVTITIPANTTVTDTHTYDVSFSLATTGQLTFNQADDWSYATNTINYAPNAKITLMSGSITTFWGNYPAQDRPTQLALAKQKIKHVIIIMQENRSFDNYFGTFQKPTSGFFLANGAALPGVNGIANAPAGNRSITCNGSTRTFNPAPLTSTIFDPDLPHGMGDAKTVLGCPTPLPPDKSCGATGALKISDFLTATNNYGSSFGNACDTASFQQTVGFYDGSTSTAPLFNYWTIANNFVLQDNMFEPVPSYSAISHLFMVSGWSANCTTRLNPPPGAACLASSENYANTAAPYAWHDISSVLQDNGVSWNYFKGENFDFNCNACKTAPETCVNASLNTSIVFFWSPLENFLDVQDRRTFDSILGLSDFFSFSSGDGHAFPQVAWIVPGVSVSEHPGLVNVNNSPHVDLKHGEAYTTTLIQRIMNNPTLWNSSVIFVAWDDWGGYYDHVRPPVDSSGKLMYGNRVPGLTISPWISPGAGLDHQVLSFDAYLKLIEDLFLNGQRLSGDGRPSIRENEPQLGNLLDEFDFNRLAPLSPPPAVTNLSCQAP